MFKLSKRFYLVLYVYQYYLYLQMYMLNRRRKSH